MRKATNKPYDAFIKALSSTKQVNRGWRGLEFTCIGTPIALWNSMSLREKAKVVSDSRWNHYPMTSYSESSPKRFGVIIGKIVRGAINKNDNSELSMLSKKSEGVFALYTLDNTHSSVRLKMAKRLFKSSDTRVRTRCARILPVNYMRRLLNDKSYSVKNIAINRIGFDNCYKDFIPKTISEDSNDDYFRNWLVRQALSLGDHDEIKNLIDEAKTLSYSDIRDNASEMKVAALIRRMSKEDCLYIMHLTDYSNYMQRILRDKIGE